MKSAFSLLFTLLIAVDCLSGCAPHFTADNNRRGEITLPAEPSAVQRNKVISEMTTALTTGVSTYHLSAGDKLEVLYFISAAPEVKEYILGVEDEIEVEFSNHPEMNRTHIVRPDGMITLSRIGEIHASGETPRDLAKAIEKRFAVYFRNSTVTVRVKKFNSMTAEFNMIFEYSTKGKARSSLIGIDGKIQLPLIGSIVAAGMTIDDLTNEINRKYTEKFSNVKVTVVLDGIAGKRIFVAGEVRNPGALDVNKPMTATQAIIASGGVTETGSLQVVKVLYWNKSHEPELRTINCEHILENFSIEEDVLLTDNSVIFVPKTTISKLNKVVDQYLKQLFLFNGAGLGFSYDLRNESIFNQ